MHIYRIKHSFDEGNKISLMLADGGPTFRKIYLYKNRNLDAFVPGRKIIVLRDGYLDMDDIAYICGGGIYLNQRPYLLDKYGCENLIKYVGGLDDEYKLDRLFLKYAIARACTKNRIKLSHKSNINLLNLLSSAKGY